jgi:hypothetical protein
VLAALTAFPGYWAVVGRKLTSQPACTGRLPGQTQPRSADRAGETRLKRMQYRPSLLNGFLASTGVDLTPFCNPKR